MELDEIIRALNLPNRLMTVGEVAEVKQCSVQTLRNHRSLGMGLPYFKNGRSVRYSPTDVAADIYRNRVNYFVNRRFFDD
jgi:hypothetical protein